MIFEIRKYHLGMLRYQRILPCAHPGAALLTEEAGSQWDVDFYPCLWHNYR
jgi:hypothetical protein